MSKKLETTNKVLKTTNLVDKKLETEILDELNSRYIGGMGEWSEIVSKRAVKLAIKKCRAECEKELEKERKEDAEDVLACYRKGKEEATADFRQKIEKRIKELEKLIGKNKMQFAITNTIIDKLKIYIEDEIHRTREQVKEALNYD